MNYSSSVIFQAFKESAVGEYILSWQEDIVMSEIKKEALRFWL